MVHESQTYYSLSCSRPIIKLIAGNSELQAISGEGDIDHSLEVNSVKEIRTQGYQVVCM